MLLLSFNFWRSIPPPKSYHKALLRQKRRIIKLNMKTFTNTQYLIDSQILFEKMDHVFTIFKNVGL